MVQYCATLSEDVFLAMAFGFLCNGFGWHGGIDLLRNYSMSVSYRKWSGPRETYIIVVLGSTRDAVRVLGLEDFKHAVAATPRHLGGTQDLISMIYESFKLVDGRCFNLKVAIIDQLNSNSVGLLKDLGINSLFSNGYTSLPGLGCLAYLYDFQHRYLTHLFSRKECFSREIQFCATLRDSESVVVNALSVLHDIRSFYPWADLSKVFAMPFAPPAHVMYRQQTLNLPKLAASQVQDASPFFLVANQFWMHKDHLCLFRAIKAVKEKGASRKIRLLCTGAMSDWRNKEYMEDVEAYIAENNLSEDISLLGYVGFDDLLGLMQNCIALVQPSLFEGGPGGGSVFLAASLGVPCICSDIPVNREISYANTQFFRAGDSVDLAAKLMSALLAAPAHFEGPDNIAYIEQSNLRLSRELVKAFDVAAKNRAT